MNATLSYWRGKVTTTKKWALGVSATVSGSIFVVLILLWAGHFEATAQTGRTAEETKEATDKLITVVEGLVSIHDAEEAGKIKTAEFCNAGMLSDCQVCAESGVTLEKCKE